MEPLTDLDTYMPEALLLFMSDFYKHHNLDRSKKIVLDKSGMYDLLNAPPHDLLNGTFLWILAEHFSNGDREVKDQIKTRRRFFCNFFVIRPKYFLVGCFRWGSALLAIWVQNFRRVFSPKGGGPHLGHFSEICQKWCRRPKCPNAQ